MIRWQRNLLPLLEFRHHIFIRRFPEGAPFQECDGLMITYKNGGQLMLLYNKEKMSFAVYTELALIILSLCIKTLK